METWKAIPGLEGYDVSSKGRVRSYWIQVKNAPISRPGGWIKSLSPQRILSTKGRNAGRYPSVSINYNTYRVHNLMMLAFHGEPPDGMIVCHNDDNPTNNTLENLRYDTPKSNILDAIDNGANIWKPRLSENNVSHIRRSLASYQSTPRQLAEDLNVTEDTILAAAYGRGAYEDISCSAPKLRIRSPRNGYKLTPAQVLKIKRLLSLGTMTQREIADKFDIHESTVSCIRHGKRWAWIVPKDSNDGIETND